MKDNGDEDNISLPDADKPQDDPDGEPRDRFLDENGLIRVVSQCPLIDEPDIMSPHGRVR